MKDRKYEFPDYAPYDYHYIQRHLTEMAEKGWRLEKISSFGLWRYRRAEPAKVRYEVTYAPSASAYNSRPTAQEEALTDICAEAGWVKAASVAQLHIYCNEDPDATPLETDELSRIRTLRKAMNRHFIPQYLMLAALFLVQCFMQWSNVRRWPVTTLSSPLMVGNLLMLSLVVLVHLTIIAGYLHWSHRAERAAEEGTEVPESVFYRRFRIVLWFVLVVYLALILLTAELWITGTTLAAAAVMFAVTGFTLECCKEMGAPRWANVLIPFVVTMVVLMLATPLIFGFLDTVSLEEQDYPEELPLMLTDLTGGAEEDLVTVTYEQSGSLAASRVRAWQETTDQDGPSIHYTILDTDVGFIYEMCCNQLEQEFMRSAEILADGSIQTNQGSLWGAEYARRAPDDSSDLWFICWEDRIVSLRASWTLTEEQIAVAAEILKP